MQRKTFVRILNFATWVTAIFMISAFVLLGDFVVEGGLVWPILVVFAILFASGSVLLFTRCQACRQSLAWISTRKNFSDQPDPRKLDLCPNCGEPFFKEPNPES